MGSSLLIIFVRLGLPTLILRVFFPQILSIRGRPCGSPGNTWMTTSSTWTGSSSWTTRSTCLEAAKNSMSWVRKRGPSADFKQRLQGLYFFWGRWLLLKTRPFVKAVKRVGFHTKDRASSSLAEQRTPGLKGNSSLRNVLPFLWVEPSSFGAFFYSMMTFVSWIRINWSVTSPFFIGSAFLVAKCQHLALPGSNGSNGAQGDFQLLGDPLIGIDWDSW